MDSPPRDDLEEPTSRRARDAADEAAAAAAHARAAREILALADRHQRDGQLSVVEIETFLKGSEHEEFATWLLQRRAARFKTFDRDHGADLDLAELAAALAQVRGTPTRCFCCRRRSLVLSEWALAPRSRSRALL